MAALKQAKITLHQAIVAAQREVPGSWVVDADIATVKGQVSYSVEVVGDGLHAVRVDLETGQILHVVKSVSPQWTGNSWRPQKRQRSAFSKPSRFPGRPGGVGGREDAEGSGPLGH
jgi:Peptidase propeptide and YPEB domain